MLQRVLLWISWNKVLTGLTILIVPAIAWFVWDEVSLGYGIHRTIPQQVQENTQAIQEVSKKVDTILRLLREQERRDLTVSGIVRIVEDHHEFGACLWVNELSRASIHEGSSRVRVTNLSDTSRRTSILTIQGTVSSSTENLIGEICGNAAAMLNAKVGDRLYVRIEPLEVD